MQLLFGASARGGRPAWSVAAVDHAQVRGPSRRRLPTHAVQSAPAAAPSAATRSTRSPAPWALRQRQQQPQPATARSPSRAASTPAAAPAASSTAAATAAAATTTHTSGRDVSELLVNPGSSLAHNAAGPVLVWFRNDLRVDDHPGLAAAAAACRAAGPGSGSGSGSGRALLPLYVLDPERLSHLAYMPGGPEALSAALQRLRADLRALGSDLVVRLGAWEQQLPAAAAAGAAGGAGGAAAVVTEDEVEVRYRQPAQQALVGAAAAAAPGKGGPVAFSWTAPLWPAEKFDNRYRAWRDKRGAPAEPMAPPSALPPLPAGVEPGAIPTAAELRTLLSEAALAALGSGSSADSGLTEVARAAIAAAAASPDTDLARRLAAAPESPLQLLRMYLGTAPAAPAAPASASVSIDEEVEALRRPGVDGAPFTGLFGTAKALGTLSVRRVLKEAYVADGRPYGSVEPRRLRSPAAVAAGVGAEAADFHRALAVLDDTRTVAPGVEVHFWRWRGGLTDYCVAEPASPLPGAPAVLLVHGFGAFGDQWRGNMGQLAAAGFRVFAPTFPGFGRSQKAAVPYSQDLWRDFLRDFTLQVVGGPVVVAGNSIGGFISSSMAADYPALVAGLVLLNSAGPVDGTFSIDAWRAAVAAGRKAPPALVVSAVSSALFWYLERTVPSTLKWLYPTNPAKADEWLATEILRAAGDSGAVDVFKAVFYLPPPRALNWLVKDAYGGPAMVLQGALDPLNDAKSRAKEMGALCPNVEVVLLQAGHCPHDEVPDQVNEALLGFIRRSVLPRHGLAAPAGTQQAGPGAGGSQLVVGAKSSP
ncbi:hypothetical protein HYH02_009271 [Chlamydomonas schloesseri]|uniref:Photolyase/cryptochrome alpha/beta domain-containing protein n=1 Tax=Chlamydomonas schloesseri TaxID=2026947 RepID=A0A835TM54_9CHLO|nr:hypothetical protein HYH02_009271 [Chlamydomonas schloesseri]|eukprot:KAG2443194.1 hypothetical protein HYH02_009271 [Chlamydomonas schloesseri]